VLKAFAIYQCASEQQKPWHHFFFLIKLSNLYYPALTGWHWVGRVGLERLSLQHGPCIFRCNSSTTIGYEARPWCFSAQRAIIVVCLILLISLLVLCSENRRPWPSLSFSGLPTVKLECVHHFSFNLVSSQPINKHRAYLKRPREFYPKIPIFSC